jgi:hypothetical protein
LNAKQGRKAKVMPKNKKAKTSHGKKKDGGDQELSQAEMWDDRALVRSWNEAVREYEVRLLFTVMERDAGR